MHPLYEFLELRNSEALSPLLLSRRDSSQKRNLNRENRLQNLFIRRGHNQPLVLHAESRIP